MSDYPALEYLLSAYFHQDWRAEHDTPEAVVAAFLDDEDEEQAAGVRADLARLAAHGLDEDALGRELRALGCEYDPVAGGGSWQDWLASLRAAFG
jgi:hypothetical protein